MSTIEGSFSMLGQTSILVYLLKGVLFTLIISIIAVGLGIVIGSVLALARNYLSRKNPFRWLSITYIEVFRNTPLLLWIFICIVFFPLPEFMKHRMFGLTSVDVTLLYKAAAALILFTSSVIAEIVRGGLNSVAQGQFEAGYSQGFSTVQVMIYIILPQAYRNIVPTLLSQIITTVKDSSYLANVAVIELMARTKTLLSKSYDYNGTGNVNVSDVFVLFGLAMLIYFIINFTLSMVVRYMQTNRKIPVAKTEKELV